MFLGGMVKQGVITAPLSFNWSLNNLIDKCCKEAVGWWGWGGAALHLWPQNIL